MITLLLYLKLLQSNKDLKLVCECVCVCVCVCVCALLFLFSQVDHLIIGMYIMTCLWLRVLSDKSSSISHTESQA